METKNLQQWLNMNMNLFRKMRLSLLWFTHVFICTPKTNRQIKFWSMEVWLNQHGFRFPMQFTRYITIFGSLCCNNHERVTYIWPNLCWFFPKIFKLNVQILVFFFSYSSHSLSRRIRYFFLGLFVKCLVSFEPSNGFGFQKGLWKWCFELFCCLFEFCLLLFFCFWVDWLDISNIVAEMSTVMVINRTIQWFYRPELNITLRLCMLWGSRFQSAIYNLSINVNLKRWSS